MLAHTVTIDVRVLGETIAAATALYALYGYVRRPSREGLELVVGLVSFTIAAFFDVTAPLRDQAFVALGAAAGPYLTTQLADHFRPTPRWLSRVMLAGFAYVVIAVLYLVFVVRIAEDISLMTMPPSLAPFVLVQIAYAMTGFAYAAWVFIGESRGATGARRLRLRLAALGVIGVVAQTVIGAAGTIWIVAQGGTVDRDARLFAAYFLLVPAIGILFLCAFAPPPWLRQMWRLAELRRFLVETASLSIGERGHEALDALVTAAARATGASGVSVWREGSAPDGVSLRGLEAEVAASRSNGVATISARGIAVPIRTREQSYGVLGLTFRRPPLFPRDDAEVVELMAEHTAISLANDELFRAQRALEERERLRTQAELARVDEELVVARQIQRALLPQELPDLPGWRIASYYEPAREVGGDFYDVFPLSDGTFAIVVGDASGKGIPAALLMATTRSLIRAASTTARGPGDVLATANEILFRAMPANMFVTCMVVALEPSTGRLRYANAGHDVGYLCGEGRADEVRARGMPLGLMPGSRYDEVESFAPPGSTIVLYSDGIVEAHDAKREMFSFDRLRSVVSAPNGDLIETVLRELRAFTPSDWEQEDDITILTVARQK